jgi:hypothetical protein
MRGALRPGGDQLNWRIEMRKLLALIMISVFAVSGAYAASHAGGKMDAKKDEKKAEKK